jgi:hypothetical protein
MADDAGFTMHEAQHEAPDLSVLRMNRRPPPPFPLHLFGPIWSRRIERAAASASAPVDYVAAPLLACASAAIGNARWAQVHPGWKEPPHLWCASVGDSGGSKSPGADAVLPDAIADIERELRADYPDRHREWQQQVALAEARREQWKRDVATAQKKGDPPPAMPEGTEAPPEPRRPVFRCNDVTHEKVGDLLANATPKGLLMVRDELAGWLLGMSSYSDAARPFWLEASGGRPYRVDRQKNPEPILIRHNAVAWWGGVQPAKLAEVSRTPDDGLLSRFLWFWPDEAPFALPVEPPDGLAIADAMMRLHLLTMAQGQDGPEPIVIPLHRDAVQDMEAFARDMQRERGEVTGLMASAYGKARGLALRLSVVFEHLAWAGEASMAPPPSCIGRGAFLSACTFVSDYAMPMALRVYGDAAMPERDRKATALARWIVRHKLREVGTRAFARGAKPPGIHSSEDVRDAAAALVDAGWLLPMASGGPGRPKAAWAVNPRLWETPPSAPMHGVPSARDSFV